LIVNSPENSYSLKQLKVLKRCIESKETVVGLKANLQIAEQKNLTVCYLKIHYIETVLMWLFYSMRVFFKNEKTEAVFAVRNAARLSVMLPDHKMAILLLEVQGALL
jgi:hypothetical protein